MKKSSLAVKIVSFGYIGLLIALTIASFIYLFAAPDFVAPQKVKPVQNLDLGDYTVYEYECADFEDYMTEAGIWTADDVASKKNMTVIGTENWIINNLDVIWWDVDNLVEGTDAYNYWKEFEENEKNDDARYIMFGGTVYMPTFNGPFAINVNKTFTGDAVAVMDALNNFPSKYSKKKNHLTDFVNYMVKSKMISEGEEVYESVLSVGSANRMVAGIEYIWWDLDNLAEDSVELANYNVIKENGKITIDGKEYSYTMNGNFAIRFTDDFSGDADKASEAFKNWDLK